MITTSVALSWWEAILLGIVEGVTEYLPVSSTGHLTIVEKLLGMPIDDPGVVAFTAIIQIGAIVAAVIYFWSDIWRIATAWFRGLGSREERRNPDYTFGWGIILGSIPIAVVGLLFKDFIETGLRSLYFVAGGLLLWSVVLWLADRREPQPGRTKSERGTSPLDAILIGTMQCVSLIPGVSRSGSTIAAGLLLGYDRVVATRLSFFLGIPALVAAGTLEAITQFSAVSNTVGWTATIIGIVVSFICGYASIAWLLKFVSNHSFTSFIVYRIIIGVIIVLLVVSGLITAV
ncbi:MAG: undecaprenyl-diphosphate phosphatase [Actinomycetaceae bacterium]|nr:undecaprenyl-diphosphate phosphatase [Actinomycetaceae bacterium]